MVVDVKNLTPTEIHNVLDSITLRLLNLSQDLIHAKLRLEELTKQVRLVLLSFRGLGFMYLYCSRSDNILMSLSGSYCKSPIWL